jgi:hypothetical protein
LGLLEALSFFFSDMRQMRACVYRLNHHKQNAFSTISGHGASGNNHKAAAWELIMKMDKYASAEKKAAVNWITTESNGIAIEYGEDFQEKTDPE